MKSPRGIVAPSSLKEGHCRLLCVGTNKLEGAGESNNGRESLDADFCQQAGRVRRLKSEWLNGFEGWTTEEAAILCCEWVESLPRCYILITDRRNNVEYGTNALSSELPNPREGQQNAAQQLCQPHKELPHIGKLEAIQLDNSRRSRLKMTFKFATLQPPQFGQSVCGYPLIQGPSKRRGPDSGGVWLPVRSWEVATWWLK